MFYVLRIDHVRFGRVLGMSTRKGDAVFLSDILDEARDRMIDKMMSSHSKYCCHTGNSHCKAFYTTYYNTVCNLLSCRPGDYTSIRRILTSADFFIYAWKSHTKIAFHMETVNINHELLLEDSNKE